MAKKKEKTIEETEITKSIGEQMKSKLTQRERNLAVKAEMIEKGERKMPTIPHGMTTKERNLANKAEMNKTNEKEKEKDGKGKGKA